jgi:hypothetical protein
MRTKITVWPLTIALVAQLLGQIEDNCYEQAVILSCQGKQWLTRIGLHIRGISNGQLPCSKAFARDEVQYLKGIIGGMLIVLIVRDQTSAIIRGEYFGRLEVLAGKRRFARSRRADQDN